MALNKLAGDMLAGFEHSMKPYRGDPSIMTQTRLPEAGCGREDIIALMETIKAREEVRWQSGLVSGAVYHGDPAHVEFQNRVYALNSQSNALHVDLWPSTTKFEAEIVSMTAHMLGADKTRDEIVGSTSSGGTESILLAMKTYRDWARDKKHIKTPEMVVPSTAHAAFDKASQYFGIKKVTIQVGDDFRANVAATRKAINKNTIVVVGSAPPFPHGIVDPIEELSELARERGIGFHTDACLGGFLLPWAEKLGYPVPPFDFRLPGVTSMSADTHKYGYAAKGTSVVLYRGQELRHYQYYTTTDWPGGLYFSPTFAGSRSGGVIAACWAALVSIGEKGYLDAASRILETAAQIKAGIAEIPGLYVLGDPLFCVAFGSKKADIYAISDAMDKRGWNLNGLQKPAAVHLCVTLRHTQPGLVDKFLSDLHECADFAAKNPNVHGSLQPVYGLTGNIVLGGMVSGFLKQLMDMLYRV